MDIGAFEIQGFLTVQNANDNGTGSLRQVITEANGSPGFETIVFDPTFFSTQRTISLLTPLPILTDNVTLFGPGKDLLTLDRSPGAASFRILEANALITNIFGVTVSGGSATGGAVGAGLAIGGPGLNATLDGVVLTANTTTGRGVRFGSATAGFSRFAIARFPATQPIPEAAPSTSTATARWSWKTARSAATARPAAAVAVSTSMELPAPAPRWASFPAP